MSVGLTYYEWVSFLIIISIYFCTEELKSVLVLLHSLKLDFILLLFSSPPALLLRGTASSGQQKATAPMPLAVQTEDEEEEEPAEALRVKLKTEMAAV